MASGSLFTESSDLWCWKAKPPESATNCSISKNLLRVTEDASQVQEILILKSPTVIFYIKSTVDTLLDAVARSVTDGQKRAIGRGKKKVRISAWVVGICWLLHSMCALFMWSKCLSESEIGSVTLCCILSVKLVDHFKSGLNVESTIRAGTACATNVQN